MENNINKLLIDTIEPYQLQDLEELQARFDSRQSFYKKAYIGTFIFGNGEVATYLKSYNTIVACIYKNQLRVYGFYSQTTARHIKEFAKQNDFETPTTKQMKNTCIIKKGVAE